MLRKNVVAVIPARANSKRIPGKNYKKFNGKSIIAKVLLKDDLAIPAKPVQ